MDDVLILLDHSKTKQFLNDFVFLIKSNTISKEKSVKDKHKMFTPFSFITERNLNF